MPKHPHAETFRLSDLIDLGYSKCFAVQFEHAYDMDDSDFYVFDELDREIWGQTPMVADPAVMETEDGVGVSGYSSEWLTPLYRLICVATVDPAKAMTEAKQGWL